MSNPVDTLGSATEATYEQVLPRCSPIRGSTPSSSSSCRRSSPRRKTLPTRWAVRRPAQRSRVASLISGAAMPCRRESRTSRIRSPPVEPWESRQRGRNGCVARRFDSVPKRIDRDAARSLSPPSRGARRRLDPAGTRARARGLRHPRRPRAGGRDGGRGCGCSARAGAARSRQERGSGRTQTETGGVAVGLESEAEVREAAERIGPPVLVSRSSAAVPSFSPGSSRTGLGPLVAFGRGVFLPS